MGMVVHLLCLARSHDVEAPKEALGCSRAEFKQCEGGRKLGSGKRRPEKGE